MHTKELNNCSSPLKLLITRLCYKYNVSVEHNTTKKYSLSSIAEEDRLTTEQNKTKLINSLSVSFQTKTVSSYEITYFHKKFDVKFERDLGNMYLGNVRRHCSNSIVLYFRTIYVWKGKYNVLKEQLYNQWNWKVIRS